MFDEKYLYLSISEVSCFDNDPPAGDPPAGNPPAGNPPAGNPPAGDPPGDPPGDQKMHTTEAVNKIVEERLARDRKSREAAHKEAYTKLEGTYNELLQTKNLSEEVRAKAETELDDVRNQLRTKEERAKHEKDQLQTTYEEQLTKERADREIWENRFHDSSISRALQDAAVSHDAYNSDQVMQLLRPMTSLKPIIDEITKKDTGQFRTVVDFPDHDEKGDEVTFSGTPDEIVKRMRDLGPYANLFKSNVVAGLGANNATGGVNTGSNGQVDVTKLTPAQYRKIREDRPELLGLNPK